ncbi:cytoplasmic dynein 1 light intermediate chain [Trichophyton mentagrophytes]|nr:cytoplasmic dynein 1 light intermediate chain [Trichophyton mentagrophytes]
MPEPGQRLSQISASKGGSDGRPGSKDGKKELWSSMLHAGASGKRLPEKTLLVLGGTPESQREFLATLSTDHAESGLPAERRKQKAPPIANQFALGYTYQNVLDAEQEDILARISIYLLSEPSASYAPLLRPLINPKTVPEMLIVFLLDWENPWTWVRELREWVRLLRSVLISLDDETKVVMEEVMSDWKDRRRGLDPSHVPGSGPVSSIPLGPGEWDEGLGIPTCVVCQGAEKIEQLEKDHGWREEEFDYILQFMRTILLKHGSSLIYTTRFLANSLQGLIQSSLGIHSLLKRQSLKHNVIDRDKILVPSNWDSWGKIRIIREGFNIEGVGTSWSVEIQGPPESLKRSSSGDDEEAQEREDPDSAASAVAVYEQTIKDPKGAASISRARQSESRQIEVTTVDSQAFLTEQVEVLEQLKAEDEKQERQMRKGGGVIKDSDMMMGIDDMNRVNEHIGPVQFNMGGIQVDADDMLRRLKEREASRASARSGSVSPTPPGGPTSPGIPPIGQGTDGKLGNEGLATFFAGLMKKSGGSPRSNTAT